MNGVAFASFVASGQTCVSGTRILVQHDIYDKFMSLFIQKANSIRSRMGDRALVRSNSLTQNTDVHITIAMNPKSTMGTVISSHHLQRIESMITRTSGKVITGGQRMLGKSELDEFDFSKGSFFPPTIISGINPNDELWKEEIFGPVVVIRRFSVGYL